MSDVIGVALISALFTFLGSVLTIVIVTRKQVASDAKRASADSSEANTRANIVLLDPLTKRVQHLEEKSTQLEAEVSALKEMNFNYLIGIKRLIRQILDAHMDPVWVPNDFDLKSMTEDQHG